MEYQIKKETQNTNSKMIDLSQNVPVIKLINRINTPITRQRLSDWI